VGLYLDANGVENGFLYDGTTWNTLNFPGAKGTGVVGIDGNNLVGYYRKSPNGLAHGFLYDGTTWKALDVAPGATYTVPTDIIFKVDPSLAGAGDGGTEALRIKSTADVLVVGLIMMTAAFFWTITWTVAFLGVYDHYLDDLTSRNANILIEWSGVLIYGGMFTSYLWTLNVCMVSTPLCCHLFLRNCISKSKRFCYFRMSFM
jgi:hypothetical protein